MQKIKNAETIGRNTHTRKDKLKNEKNINRISIQNKPIN